MTVRYSIDRDRVDALVKDGLAQVTKHPERDLWIANYSDHCARSRLWRVDDLLLDLRGLVFDASGQVVARGWRKFFNVSEWEGVGLDDLAALGGDFEVAEKLDGSLILAFTDPKDNALIVASRGSFVSSHAQEAEAYLRATYPDFVARSEAFARMAEGVPIWTCLFEWTGPQNRHVVRYDQPALTLIGIVEPYSGHEVSYARLARWASDHGVPAVQALAYDDWGAFYERVGKVERPNAEGYVIHWPAKQVRVKVKHEEYLRLHRIIFGLSGRAIWEVLREAGGFGKVQELIAALDEEDGDWVRAVSDGLIAAHADLTTRAYKFLHALIHEGVDTHDRASRGLIARRVIAEQPDIQHVVFTILDDKDPRAVAWRGLEPASAPLRGQKGRVEA